MHHSVVDGDESGLVFHVDVRLIFPKQRIDEREVPMLHVRTQQRADGHAHLCHEAGAVDDDEPQPGIIDDIQK